MKATTNHVVQELGQLVIYRKQTLTHPFGDGMYYYTDKRDVSAREVGPFTNISMAVEHWGEYMVPLVLPGSSTRTLEAATGFIETPVVAPPVVPEEPLPNNVIYVDFIAKKRR